MAGKLAGQPSHAMDSRSGACFATPFIPSVERRSSPNCRCLQYTVESSLSCSDSFMLETETRMNFSIIQLNHYHLPARSSGPCQWGPSRVCRSQPENQYLRYPHGRTCPISSVSESVFPIQVGKEFRQVISLAFRLLHPYYWPSSFWNFLVTKVQALWQSSQEFVNRLWETFPLRQWQRHVD